MTITIPFPSCHAHHPADTDDACTSASRWDEGYEPRGQLAVRVVLTHEHVKWQQQSSGAFTLFVDGLQPIRCVVRLQTDTHGALPINQDPLITQTPTHSWCNGASVVCPCFCFLSNANRDAQYNNQNSF